MKKRGTTSGNRVAQRLAGTEMDERELEDAMECFAELIVASVVDDYDPYEAWDGDDD